MESGEEGYQFTSSANAGILGYKGLWWLLSVMAVSCPFSGSNLHGQDANCMLSPVPALELFTTMKP